MDNWKKEKIGNLIKKRFPCFDLTGDDIGDMFILGYECGSKVAVLDELRHDLTVFFRINKKPTIKELVEYYKSTWKFESETELYKWVIAEFGKNYVCDFWSWRSGAYHKGKMI